MGIFNFGKCPLCNEPIFWFYRIPNNYICSSCKKPIWKWEIEKAYQDEENKRKINRAERRKKKKNLG